MNHLETLNNFLEFISKTDVHLRRKIVIIERFLKALKRGVGQQEKITTTARVPNEDYTIEVFIDSENFNLDIETETEVFGTYQDLYIAILKSDYQKLLIN